MQNNPLCALFYTSMFQTYNRSRCCSTTIVYNIKYLILNCIDILLDCICILLKVTTLSHVSNTCILSKAFNQFNQMVELVNRSFKTD